MPPDCVIFACFAIALYFYINLNSQVRSTASAIQSVFTGECRMACRQSQGSGLSGLSGLQGPGPSQNYNTIGANCICESCPCPMIENFIRTCSPATRMYTIVTSMMSQMYCNIIASLVGTTSYDPDENFNFKDRDIDENSSIKSFERDNKPLQTLTKETSSLGVLKEKIKSKTSMVSKKSVTTFIKALLNKKKSAGSSDEDTSKRSDTESLITSASTSRGIGACPQCVEMGEICLRDCPHKKQ